MPEKDSLTGNKWNKVVKTTHPQGLRALSCLFVVKPHPHGFVHICASSWQNIIRMASRPFAEKRPSIRKAFVLLRDPSFEKKICHKV